MIILSPYSHVLRTGNVNPKNYPHWQPVVDDLIEGGHHVVQVGLWGERQLVGTETRFGLPLSVLTDLVEKCKTWASVDNFFPHMCSHTSKPGVVVWGRSDPEIYGYSRNVNLLKDRSFLRPDPFGHWPDCAYDADAFVHPDLVVEAILKLYNL